MAKDSILFIVAHPDDIAFSCGGTAWLLKQQYDLHVLCASKGERGYPGASSKPGSLPEPSSEIANIRAKEEQDSCDLLGASLTFLNQIDGEIHPDRETCNQVSSILSELKPKAVLTHGPFEKKDHNATFSIAYQALCLSNLFFETDLCMFFQDAGTYNMQSPCIFVNIDEVIEHKIELIKCHKSHFIDEATPDDIIVRNHRLGSQTFCDYAEAFTSPFPMINKRWGRKPECGRILLDL